MFKLLALLCAAIFVTMLIGGREGGAVRYGLVPGKMASLVYDAPAKVQVAAQTVPQGAEPVAVTRAVQTAAAPVQAEPAGGLIEAAFVAPEATGGLTQTGLTLALPLVAAQDAEPLADAVQTAPDEPVVQYVIGSSVNVRQGPSADSEALTKLPRGEAVQVIASNTPGWSLIRIEGDGVEGYIASRFLSGAPQDGLFGNN